MAELEPAHRGLGKIELACLANMLESRFDDGGATINASDVAAACGVSRSRVFQVINDLVASGIIVNVGKRKSDGRGRPATLYKQVKFID